jgi:tRNA dimethylallyltransferase
VNTDIPLIDDSGRPRVALIAGPTASGKSAIALALAARMPVTIINADASQVYRDLRILSARPSEEEEATCPHKLFGHIDGATACSAAQWAGEAKLAIAEAHAAGRLPVLVGGTGLYIRTLLDGIAPVPEIAPEIRTVVRRLDVSDAYAALTSEDPDAAARLAPADGTRIARALEVIRSTGRTLADWQQDKAGGVADSIALTPLILLPPRDWLFARCDARFDTMLSRGGVNEVQSLLARGLDPALPVMRAIGVREVAQIIADPSSTERYVTLAKIATRQYAKRQYTWFRNQPPTHWHQSIDILNEENISYLVIKLQQMALT